MKEPEKEFMKALWKLENQTAKVIMTLGVRWKKSAKLIITLYPDDIRKVLGCRQ